MGMGPVMELTKEEAPLDLRVRKSNVNETARRYQEAAKALEQAKGKVVTCERGLEFAKRRYELALTDLEREDV